MSVIINTALAGPKTTRYSNVYGALDGLGGTGMAGGGGTPTPSNINNIGTPGAAGYGVGICPPELLPAGFTPMSGYTDPSAPGYGGYIYSDGSHMRWRPAFWEKVGNGANGVAANDWDIKRYSHFADEAAANAAGYRLPMAFRNAGVIQPGYFEDEFLCSNNGGTASSLPLGNPLSFHPDHNPVTALTGAPANILASAIPAAKTRGANFIPAHRGMGYVRSVIALTHGAASVSDAFCAWYDASGVTNCPNGCNNNALGDVNDATLTFVSDGYLNCCKTGSANNLAKTADNGQLCGIKDVNGTLWEVQLGITADASNFYVAKPGINWTTLTNGTTLATDAWGATGIAANYDSLGATYGPLQNSSTIKRIGLAEQTFAEDLSGLAYMAAQLGIPINADATGTNRYGLDGLWDYRPANMCPRAGGSWSNDALAGVWALILGSGRGSTGNNSGFRAALYL